MNKVLIALDYEPTAEKVAEAGYALAKAMDAEVVLLHVTDIPVYYSSAAYSPIMGFDGYVGMDLLQPDISQQLNKTSLDFLQKSKEHLGDANITSLVAEGEIAEAILETATNINADLIVLGSHSRRGLDAILMGSVTEKVLAHSKVPLYIIPTKK
jgi:nucleotide-binding universal stress UspA family protein